jgi:hypothetical protein
MVGAIIPVSLENGFNITSKVLKSSDCVNFVIEI